MCHELGLSQGSGRAMEMALAGRLNEFNPDTYVEPEVPSGFQPSRRGRSTPLLHAVVTVSG